MDPKPSLPLRDSSGTSPRPSSLPHSPPNPTPPSTSLSSSTTASFSSLAISPKTPTPSPRLSTLTTPTPYSSRRNTDNDSASSKLSFSVDGDRVLHIKRLKWKFRGNERVERTEGAPELSRRERRSFSRKRRIQKATKVEMNKDNNGRRQREKNELATRLAKLSRSAA
ncbi:hypothetical protein AHAS_Ahas19G0204700 [Arachis hypogaea]